LPPDGNDASPLVQFDAQRRRRIQRPQIRCMARTLGSARRG
jgi:hypothetical protein